jgi:RNA polymerase-binding transcription factor DksA
MVIDLKFIHSRLVSERKRLLEVLEQTRASATPAEERRDGSPFGKREEEASQSFELEKRLALEKQVKENLADVGRALEKFNKGTYGRCDACGQIIDPARLEALPYATMCLNCKAKNAKIKPPAL